MKNENRKTQVEPPGNGFDLDLPILTDTVLAGAYGEETPTAEFRDRLRKGGRDYYERVYDSIVECPEDEEALLAELGRFNAFVDELFRLTPVDADEGPLAFERWLAAALGAFIDEYELEDDCARVLYDIESWGLVPSDSAERQCEVPLTRRELSKAMAALPEVPLDQREYVQSGRDDRRPFEPKGTALATDGPGMVMLRHLGIVPAQWDHSYGSIIERLADDFAHRFYPVLRWIVLDPDDAGLFNGERVEVQLLPGFQELFATFLQDVLTVATNQVIRYAQGDRPGTGPGMREFAWTTTYSSQESIADVGTTEAGSGMIRPKENRRLRE